jgi:hypothetical protein
MNIMRLFECRESLHENPCRLQISPCPLGKQMTLCSKLNACKYILLKVYTIEDGNIESLHLDKQDYKNTIISEEVYLTFLKLKI